MRIGNNTIRSCAIVLSLTLGLGVVGCGKREQQAADSENADDDDEDADTPQGKWEATHFTVTPHIETFFGATPFTVTVTTTVKNAQGTVRYEWDFGDGSPWAYEPSATHTFTKPGLYTIGVAGTDETGDRDGGALIVRAMTDEEWAAYTAKVEATQKRLKEEEEGKH